jgi:hypothetical protein
MKRFLVIGLLATALLCIGIPRPVFADGEPLKGYVANTTMTLANTEYSYALPSGAGNVTIQNRGNYDVKVCFTSGASGTTYFTLKAGSAYYEERISNYGTTLYFQCATAGQVLEVVYWQ